eukprot:Skav201980  [mRNA]  locus=scaffold2336:45260:45484:- [translate_table: standard]
MCLLGLGLQVIQFLPQCCDFLLLLIDLPFILHLLVLQHLITGGRSGRADWHTEAEAIPEGAEAKGAKRCPKSEG